MSSSASFLLADIGGTNTRIAVADAAGPFRNLQTFVNDDLNDIQAVLKDVAQSAGGPGRAVIAVAGPVEADTFRLTNRNWSLSRTELASTLGLNDLIVVNDFVAMAQSVPALAASDVMSVGKGVGDPQGNILVCGPGTGFGVAALVQNAGNSIALASEAGHMRLGPASAEEESLFKRLAPSGALSIEEVLSGKGLAALHHRMEGTEHSTEILIAAAQVGDVAAAATVAAFMRVFGRIVGDLALAFDARGGIYIGGGVGRALTSFFPSEPFRNALEDHPPYRERLQAIPIHVILHLYPGLIGALRIARMSLADKD